MKYGNYWLQKSFRYTDKSRLNAFPGILTQNGHDLEGQGPPPPTPTPPHPTPTPTTIPPIPIPHPPPPTPIPHPPPSPTPTHPHPPPTPSPTPTHPPSPTPTPTPTPPRTEAGNDAAGSGRVHAQLTVTVSLVARGCITPVCQIFGVTHNPHFRLLGWALKLCDEFTMQINHSVTILMETRQFV